MGDGVNKRGFVPAKMLIKFVSAYITYI